MLIKTAMATALIIQLTSAAGGIGLNLGARIFFPDEINQTLSDLFDEMKSGYITTSVGTSDLVLGIPVKVKGIISPIPMLGIEPYAMFLWGPKFLTLLGSDLSVSANLVDFEAGSNVWFRFSPQKIFSFKAGGGAYYHHSIFAVTGDLGNVTYTGNGYGFNTGAGCDITFKRISINLDLMVPIATIPFSTTTGHFERNHAPITIHKPASAQITGFQFTPGVTFLF